MMIQKLFEEELFIVNVGVEQFAQDLEQIGVSVTNVNWRVPAGGNSKIAKALFLLTKSDED